MLDNPGKEERERSRKEGKKEGWQEDREEEREVGKRNFKLRDRVKFKFFLFILVFGEYYEFCLGIKKLPYFSSASQIGTGKEVPMKKEG